jgi:ABC-2 type transport system permease protein
VIVFLTFSAFSAEREQGTLRQLLSLGVKPTDVAGGKALGVSSALGILLVPATALGVLALALVSENGVLGAGAGRMLLMGLIYLAYFAAVIAVCLAVSASVRSSRLALVVLLGFWIFNSLIAPRAAADLAKAVHPTPSAFEFSKQMEIALRDGTDEVSARAARSERLKQELFKKYNVSRVEDLPVNFSGLVLQAGEEHGNHVFDKMYSELWATFARQEQVHHGSALVAPLLAIRALSMALAGTDFAQHAHFARAAEEYRGLIQREMNNDIGYNAVRVSGVYMRGRDLWQKIPDFRYEAPDTGWVLSRQKWTLGLLLAWTAGAVAICCVAARRLRVE